MGSLMDCWVLCSEMELTGEAMEAIGDFYAELRSRADDSALPVTVRTLETVIRLSTAAAKARLSKGAAINLGKHFRYWTLCASAYTLAGLMLAAPAECTPAAHLSGALWECPSIDRRSALLESTSCTLDSELPCQSWHGKLASPCLDRLNY